MPLPEEEGALLSLLMASTMVQGLSLAEGGRGGRAEEDEVVVPPGFRFARAARRESMRNLPET